MFNYDIFISYASADRDWAMRLNESLTAPARQLSTFFDYYTVRAGDEWQARIEDGLKTSRHLIALWSSHAKNSDWVNREIYTFYSLTRRQANSERRLIFLNLQGENQALKLLQQISLPALQIAYTGNQIATLPVWDEVMAEIGMGLDPNTRPLPIPVVVLTLTRDDLVRLPSETLKWIRDEYRISRSRLELQYGPTHADWRPVGGLEPIATLLERMRIEIDKGIPGRRVTWRALANVAEWFRLRGLKVVMIDWDLEAPGLESFFAANLAERESIRGKLGLIDLIVAYRDVFRTLPRPPVEEKSSSEQQKPPPAEDQQKPKGEEFVKILDDALPPIRQLLVPIKRPPVPNTGGNLALLPAGCRSESRFDAYAETVQQFDWADLYANFEGEAYFEWLRRQLNDPDVADIVLIDSRTGVAEMSGVCTRQLADVIVILCGPNDQNLDGVAMMARSFTRDDVLDARGGRQIDLIIVPARIDVSEGRPIDLFEAQFKSKLGNYVPHVFGLLGTDYQQLRIPYISAYAYAERLAVGEPEGVKALQDAYGLLAVHIAVLAPTASAVRRWCAESMKEAFGRLEQLEQALNAGLIDQDTYESAVAAMNARLSSRGAIAQGAKAVGTGVMSVGGNTFGEINTGVIIQQAARLGASREDLRRAYLARILTQANELPLFAGDSAKAQIRLSSVYTALLTQRSEIDATTGQLARDIGVSPERDATKLSALDVLNAERKLVLLGGPGSGKSTFVNFVALCMAGEILGSAAINLVTLTAPIPSESDSDKKPQPQRWDHGRLLPVPVVLRDFASELPAPGTAVNAGTMWQHIEGRLQRAALGDFAPYLQEELQTSGGLILLDGLDELPDPSSQRQQIKQAVQDFADTFSNCRFLVTSRTYAYIQQDGKLTGFVEVALLPSTPGQIQRFVDAWYAHLNELARLSETDAKGRAEVLKSTIERNERLAELAVNPLLLTLIARLHTERGALPEKREELYAQVVELLLNQWESLKVRFKPDGTKEIAPSLAEWLNAGRDDIRRELDKLAFEAHRDQAELVGTADIRQERLVMALLNAAPTKTDIKPKLLEEYLRDRVGLLTPVSEGLYQFSHRLFQEYLAACHLTVDRFPDELSRLSRADPNRWREATLLAAAKVARGTPESVWSLCEALCPDEDPTGHAEPPAADLGGALLAGQALWETGLAEPNPNTAPRNEKKRKRVQRWMRAMVERGWLSPLDRAIAGMALSVLGDEREFDELIPILAGEFWMGDDQDNHAKPKHRLRLPAFRIGKYPVTDGQYLRFVRATRYAWDSPDADKVEKRNHPARYVTWHDAVAYFVWLTGEWRSSGKIGASEHASLPSEAEWERAARGTDGRLFPWAEDWREDCANTIEAGIGDTCAVGMFPNGRSEAGCLDMVGNVWEWTRSLWGKRWSEPDFGYPYSPDNRKREALDAGNDVLRVVRGGSWGFNRGYARCAYRYWTLPGYRLNYFGFRVVVRSAPVP